VGRKVDVNDLVGAQEIADRLGVSRSQVVHEWRRRGIGFPEPVVTLSMGLLWSWPDVEGWARATGRLPRG
jgi:hypothetical protein